MLVKFISRDGLSIIEEVPDENPPKIIKRLCKPRNKFDPNSSLPFVPEYELREYKIRSRVSSPWEYEEV